ncbi:tetratricopeptide repeat-containing sensor histidine kinase [Lacihabitans sp. CS3-21]|nr:tetratricopeptide repeat-containing sensor histidine kinase [Lacihabitans sp. CS3-21]
MTKVLKNLIIVFWIFPSICFCRSVADSLEMKLKTSPQNKAYIKNAENYIWFLVNPLDNVKKADSILKIVKPVALKIGDFEGYARLCWYDGILYLRDSKSKASLESLERVEKLIHKHNLSKSLLQKVYAGIGNSYYHDGLLDKALSYFIRATDLTEKYNLTESVTQAYIGISNIYLTTDVSKALTMNDKLLKYTYLDTDLTMRFLGEFQIVNHLITAKNLDKALHHLKKAEFFALKYCRKSIVINAWTGYAQIFILQSKFPEAYVYLKKSKELAEKLNIDTRRSQVYGGLGYYYFLQKDYYLAENYFSKKLEIDKKDKFEYGQFEDYEILSEINSLSKNYQKALDYKIKANAIDDSLFSKKLLIKINMLEKEKQDSDIKLLGLANKNSIFQRNAILVGGILLLIISVILVISIINRNKYKRLESQQKLRNQIAADLHDEIGSTLSSISILSELVAQERTKEHFKPDIMTQVSNDARNVIEKMDEIIWTINPDNDEFYNLETRLKSYAIPLFESKDIDFKFDFSTNLENIKIDMSKRRDIYLILKEAINNLLKYSECKNAQICALLIDNDLIMKVSDDGIGFDKESESLRNGQRNMQIRAEKIGARLLVNSVLEKGTEVALFLPIK